MDEKIKITLNQSTLDTLKKDCLDFGIHKSDNKPNLNAFINLLVANFYDEFGATNEKLNDKLKSALKNLPTTLYNNTYNEVLSIIQNAGSTAVDIKGVRANLNFKPTKVSQQAVFEINNLILKNESLSSFYRRMFVAYTQKTCPMRERIIFKTTYDMLQKARSKNCEVCISIARGDVYNGAYIYDIESAKDELFNYVLYSYEKKPHTIRLSNIVSVSLTQTSAQQNDELNELFKKQIMCGVQYPIYLNQKDNIVILLTEKGKQLFKKIYLYRPNPVAIKGNVYTFNCSYNQVLYYFKRFGDTAVILSPRRIGLEMLKYHKYAFKKYNEFYKPIN